MDAEHELTAFVREVVIPGGPDAVPRIEPRHCRFRLAADLSPIHRWGIFADEPIPARRRVIEYTGARIDRDEVARRSVRTHLYIFWFGQQGALDGAIGGSGAEFINHCCDPNLYARVARGHIHLVSRRRIEAGEELTLDYRIVGGAPLRCRCGSPLCRGYMNKPWQPS
ncbi:MAG TPA: SET domain-containing protein-lysine N-methyltransferase [Rhodocyclaceae bacterium]|nr:SET domain-containing protein-lysine N-methyltransferase [Rhodocyclaceae bacterium]HMV54180.1 SET domain-containing protein-lysine N-methyltransferase [Rhodocyclaceae bacterium]HMZ83338.1 SET domain-containing protein-lysine N-methyltransferase [Rhodocyclaceae bacterium]HNA03483.1 SET domain-containing protein-lysine N-methyltransferase [Rhodocyclaceae bacterium]HNB79549.1 SET domain-containing protein-lysine N-methyltransferase [Rhodocyclaceae bacterium]